MERPISGATGPVYCRRKGRVRRAARGRWSTVYGTGLSPYPGSLNPRDRRRSPSSLFDGPARVAAWNSCLHPNGMIYAITIEHVGTIVANGRERRQPVPETIASGMCWRNVSPRKPCRMASKETTSCGCMFPKFTSGPNRSSQSCCCFT